MTETLRQISTDDVMAQLSQNINCAQMILQWGLDGTAISTATAHSLGTTLGGGAGHGSLCGAVTAAYLVIGYLFGQNGTHPQASPALAQEIKAEFDERFADDYDSVQCVTLLDLEGSIPFQPQSPQVRGQQAMLCPKLIQWVCHCLADTLDEYL